MINPGRALWYALKVDDFELAQFLISQQADIKQTYEIQPSKYLSTSSLMVLKVCQSRSKGLKSVHYENILRLFKEFLNLTQESDLRCHCSKNYEHRCPLYIALTTLSIKKESQLDDPRNEIVQLLLLRGATIKQQIKGQFVDVEGYRQYLIQRYILTQSNGFKQGKGQLTFSK